jgi:L-ascorbate metabolism protein UlaG (beta-lactamase superfamily)
MGWREQRIIGDITVQSIPSTDKGLAFLIEINGIRIYFGGDHGNWKRPQPQNAQDILEQKYWIEIDWLEMKLENKLIDIAFVDVVQPFTDTNYVFALDYLMRSLSINRVVPMHFQGDATVFDALNAAEETKPYRNRIVKYMNRGEILI